MFVDAVVWSFAPGGRESARRCAEEVVLPALRRLPGFHRYYAVRCGRDVMLTVILYGTRADAEAGFHTLLPLLRAQYGDLVEGLERFAGEVELAGSCEGGDAVGGAAG